jgi:hypothetical protein
MTEITAASTWTLAKVAVFGYTQIQTIQTAPSMRARGRNDQNTSIGLEIDDMVRKGYALSTQVGEAQLGLRYYLGYSGGGGVIAGGPRFKKGIGFGSRFVFIVAQYSSEF